MTTFGDVKQFQQAIEALVRTRGTSAMFHVQTEAGRLKVTIERS